jgi:hypothetical protein
MDQQSAPQQKAAAAPAKGATPEAEGAKV